MEIVEKVLSRIAFIAFVLFFFGLLPWMVMGVSLLKGSKILCHKWWSNIGVKLLKVRISKIPGSNKVNTKGKTMILINHRSWSDFFTHDVVSEYTANFVSRMAVGIIFPAILILSNISRSILFFKRGGKGAKELEK